MTNVAFILQIVGLFLVKHFIADFLLQIHPFTWKYKHIYGHPGGLLHAFGHAPFTFLITWIICPFEIAFMLSMCDFFVHYHIDWVKMSLNHRLNLKCDKHNGFWILVGLDQFLHSITYLGIIYVAFDNFRPLVF